MNFLGTVLAGSAATITKSQEYPSTNFMLTGSAVRDDGKVSYGYSLLRGKRASMEDFHNAQFKRHSKSGDIVGLFGVYDGHGGPNAAIYVQNNLLGNLTEHAKFASDMRSAITDTYESTDVQYCKQDTANNHGDGCTAVTAVLMGQRLLVANVGDSRAVLSRGGRAVPLSVDHKPNMQSEKDRIEKEGGLVVWAGTWRVGGVLAVSRAFGDRMLKRYVIATPDIREEWLSSEDDLLILASDGVWDVLSNQEAVTLARGLPDAERAARRLAEEAYNRGSNDNISCVVIKFNF